MGKYADDTFSLVADVGGTNTRVALALDTRILPESVRRYANADFTGFESLLGRYLAEQDNVDCTGACVAVAGPVRDGVAEMTNLDWTIDAATLARATRAEHVAILNDLQAQGFALGHLDPSRIRAVLPGSAAAPGAARLMIGIGTGFNAAAVFDTGRDRLVPASESGHISLPVRTEEELRLGRYIRPADGFVAVEDVLSGNGLERIYRWLGHEAGDERALPAARIVAAVAAGNDDRAQQAVQHFVRLLGTVVGDLALIQLPFGGVYLIGGVARAMTPHLERFGFAEAFRYKGRFAEFMGSFGVSTIEDDFAALIGSACYLCASA